MSSQDTLPPACHCSGTCRSCYDISGLIALCLPLLSDPQDLWCHLGTHFLLPATVEGLIGIVLLSQDTLAADDQGPTGPVVLSWNPLLSTQVTAGPVALSRYPLPFAAQGPAGPVLSSWDPLPPAGCSGTRRTCGALSSCMPLLRVLQDLWCCLSTQFPMPVTPQGTQDLWGLLCPLLLRNRQNLCCWFQTLCPCLLLLRDPKDLCCCLRDSCLPLLENQQDICCSLRTNCPLQAAQGPKGPVDSSQYPMPFDALLPIRPVVSSWDPLHPAGCSGSSRTCGVSWIPTAPAYYCSGIAGHPMSSQDLLPPAGCLGTHRTFAVFSGHTV